MRKKRSRGFFLKWLKHNVDLSLKHEKEKLPKNRKMLRVNKESSWMKAYRVKSCIINVNFWLLTEWMSNPK